MKASRTELWTIQQLCTEVERVLAVDYAGSRNGRVRDIPDLRTIRYYTTVGLLDRPAEMRGRTALYGRRHLLQLVAIKQLQARGLSLVPGSGADRGRHRRDAPASRRRLGPRRIWRADADSNATPGTAQDVAAGPFWKSRPVPVPTHSKSRDESGEHKGTEPERSSPLLRMRR